MSHSRRAALKIIPSKPRQRRNETGDGDSISSFPAPLLRVYVLGFEPLRAAGLQAMFSGHAKIEIILDDPSAEGESGWLDPKLSAIVIGTHVTDGVLNAIAAIRSKRRGLPILVMSAVSGDEAVLSFLNLGAKGFLHEACTAEEFEEAVSVATSGSIWASRRVLARLIDRLLSVSGSQEATVNVSFTARERQVMDLLLEGQSNREIGASLKIEERTVKFYVARLMRKMGVKNRTALSMRAMSADRD